MTGGLVSVFLTLCAPAAGGGEECRTVIIGEAADCVIGPQLLVVRWHGIKPRERIVGYRCEVIE